MTQFENQALSLVKKVPCGKVTTYAILAQKLGNKNLSRAVGNALHKNESLIVVPCHRVVKSDGKIGGYRLGVAKKAKLLHNEGIMTERGKVADLAKFLYSFN